MAQFMNLLLAGSSSMWGQVIGADPGFYAQSLITRESQESATVPEFVRVVIQKHVEERSQVVRLPETGSHLSDVAHQVPNASPVANTRVAEVEKELVAALILKGPISAKPIGSGKGSMASLSRWFSENKERYAGQWVALDRVGTLIDHDTSRHALRKRLIEGGQLAGAVLTLVPERVA